MPTSQLPCNGNAIRGLHFHYQNMAELQGKGNNTSLANAADIVVQDIVDVHDTASVVTRRKDKVKSAVSELQKKYRDSFGKDKKRGQTESIAHLTQALDKEKDILFDVIDVNRTHHREYDFISDQRGPRKLMISTQIDKSATAKNLKLQMKKQSKQKLSEKEERESKSRFASETFKETHDNSPLSTFQDTDDEFLPPRVRTKRYSTLVRKLSSKTVQVMDETNISSYTFTKVADAVLENYGILDESNRNDLLKPAQVKRVARKKRLENLTSLSGHIVRGIGFDGRKDQTLTKSDSAITLQKEEHYTVLSLPDNTYIGHSNPKTGKADDIFASIKELLIERYNVFQC